MPDALPEQPEWLEGPAGLSWDTPPDTRYGRSGRPVAPPPMGERADPPGADTTPPSVGRGARREADGRTAVAPGAREEPEDPRTPEASRPPGVPEPPYVMPPQHYYALIVERIGVLAAQGCNAPAIARELGCEGYTMAPGRSDPISLTTVRRLLRENTSAARRTPPAVLRESLAADEWWLRELAAELSMPSITLYGWARRGWVTVVRKESRPPYRLVLHADPAEAERLRALRLHAAAAAAAASARGDVPMLRRPRGDALTR
ncbi:hypothetical protein [Streptomyces apricus]|uniref:Uncharacterized protein n=1 Tax=Streptomyces apricus TaxID=1828112 RepID=A0A5B0B2M3_9ACTN|nr:hypothetical protein [Streptomyces apricus]KAA0935861.1 hypothetical protein FGF04_17935 [Streptomyces apricus]